MLVEGVKCFLKKKKKKQKNGRQRCKNLPQVEKQRLLDYKKNYYRVGKNKSAYKPLGW